MLTKKAVVIVGDVIEPKPELIQHCLGRHVPACEIVADKCFEFEELEIVEGLREIAERNVLFLSDRPDADLVMYLFFSFTTIESAHGEKPLYTIPTIFIPVRNRRGAEWIYLHTIERGALPTAALETFLANIEEALKGRADCSFEPTKVESEHMEALVRKVGIGIDEALGTMLAPSTSTLQ